ncbi:MAG: aminomethyl-transferring glycine dehydrogenase [Bacteroidales bacterium]
MIKDNFIHRHNGPRSGETKKMLQKIGISSVDALIDQTIPASIRMKGKLNLPSGMNEYEYVNHIKTLGAKNKIFRSYIGLGYYNAITPGVITRNILENPGWYTSYTPYQAEISQGRLEALLNFQTMVSDLTGMPLANASLLDEGTAASEAMIMFYNSRPRSAVKAGVKKFYISDQLFPQTIEVIRTKARPLGIELVVEDHEKVEFDDDFFGAIVQYPDQKGNIRDYRGFVKKVHATGAYIAASADIMSLALLTPPAEWGADVVLGSTQRFGVPLGFGGPHAAYFATTEKFKRNIPGRIIGVSIDSKGNRALRMALQTREQHIKRERATSNICTAQALLASMAGMYAVYHGPGGIQAIARDIHNNAVLLKRVLVSLKCEVLNDWFFDTLEISLPGNTRSEDVRRLALEREINFRYFENGHIGISLDETTSDDDINDIIHIFSTATGNDPDGNPDIPPRDQSIPDDMQRKTPFLQQPVFNAHHSETAMMRYLSRLENRDLALNRTMIPLGSCTMKLNAAAELFPLSWPEFGSIHPFVPGDQALGYEELIRELGKDLCEITGFDDISFQPNSGAAGEYAGLMVIRAYHESNGEGHRNICLIPSSAHGTNPASSVMAGMKVVIVKCDDHGNIDLEDLKKKAELNKDNLAAIMITYPSTHGVFEEDILEIIDVIHQCGGQVYMDGANMNAQVGLTSPGLIGADVCHLNLHKTFAIPHGGGGPGMGPIGVAKHLSPFLPRHTFCDCGGEKGIPAVSSAPFGSAMILPISYGYIKLLGGEGLTEATRYAILGANYLKSSLEGHYKILYAGKNGRVAHEFILDCNAFNKTADITVVNIAKRLMDYGFHAPTVAFPVPGTLMVEPTESEPLSELNRFIEAMLSIREELKEIEEGRAGKDNNLIRNAPHTLEMMFREEWKYPYSKNRAAFPKSWLYDAKYWVPVTKIDDAYGDRNLVCTCDPVENY